MTFGQLYETLFNVVGHVPSDYDDMKRDHPKLLAAPIETRNDVLLAMLALLGPSKFHLAIRVAMKLEQDGLTP